jgi:glycosyltransferase involved in cell wall biosynthesis
MVDVLIISLGSTGGLRTADRELAESLRRAGASVEVVQAERPGDVRTMMLTDLRWALAARHATRAYLRGGQARSIIYSSTTAALLWPRPGAIRFDAPAAGNRPGRHGLWQRPLERRRLAQSPLLLPWSEGGLVEASATGLRAPAVATDSGESARALVVPVSVEPSGPQQAERDIAAITYGANPAKKGLDRVLEAWRRVRRPSEELVVAGATPESLRRAGMAVPAEGVRVTGMLASSEYRALLRRARVFVCAPRREDYGIAQLEALADGCQLVTTPAPGPYAALEAARTLDPRLVTEDIGAALRVALDNPTQGYAERAAQAILPFGRAAVDERVGELGSRLAGSA